MSLKSIGVLTLLMTSVLNAQTLHLGVLGGGGEPRRPTTIFDDSLRAVGQFKQSHPGVKTTIAFNGGHTATEEIARSHFGSSTPFTAQNYNAIISDYVRKISSGEIRPGDKLLLYVNTHGAAKTQVETTHSIATSGSVVTNFDTFGGPSAVSMDNLKQLTELASRRGVKLGIIDLSCHSGNTLALANANTCVISSTGPNHYAGAGSLSFGTLISKELKRGRSLEEIFLSARQSFTDTSFPMISSPAGKDVQSRLYDPMTPYLYYYNPHQDKFTPYMEQATCPGNCRTESGFNALMAEIQGVLRVTKDSSVKQSVTAFQAAVKEYQDYLRDLQGKMARMGMNELSKSFRFCSGKECVDYSLKQLLSMNIESTIRFYENQGGSTNQAYANILRQAQSKRDEALRRNPNLRQAKDFWSSLPDLQRKTSILQSKVARTQHQLYLELYRSSSQSGPNPCKDFVL